MQANEASSRKRVRPLVVGESRSLIWGRWIYLAAFFFYVFASWMSGTTYEYVAGLSIDVFRKVFYALALGLLLIKFTLQEYELLDLVRVAIPGLIFALSAHVSGERVLLWAFLFIAAAQDIDIRDLAGIMLAILIVVGLAAIVGSLTGIIELKFIDKDPNALRYALGFLHPNTLARWAAMLFLCYFTLRDGRVGRAFFIWLALAAICVTAIARSSTGVLVFVSLALFAYLRRASIEGKQQKLGKSFYILFCAFILLVSLLFIYFMFFFNRDSESMVELSDFFSYRPRASHAYYLESGSTLFGYNWENSSVDFFDAWGIRQLILVDTTVCRVYLQYGVLAFILACASYTFMLVRECKEPITSLGIGLALFAFYGLSEFVCVLIDCNFFLVSFAALLYPNYESSLDVNAPELAGIPAIKRLIDTD